MDKSEKELNSLIYLLDDPDREIYSNVKTKLIGFGKQVLERLESTWEFTQDELVQERIEEIIHQINFEQLKGRFSEWLDADTHDLFDGINLVCTYQYPDLNFERIKSILRILKKDIWLEMGLNYSPIKSITIFNRLFFESYGFKAVNHTNETPQYLYINHVLSAKKGEPLSISLIYILLANQLNIPVHAIALPNNQIILAYLTHPFNPVLPAYSYDGDIEFLINPAEQGGIFNKDHFLRYLKANGFPADLREYAPCTNIQLIRILLDNIGQYYETHNRFNKSSELKELISMLDQFLDKLKEAAK